MSDPLNPPKPPSKKERNKGELSFVHKVAIVCWPLCVTCWLPCRTLILQSISLLVVLLGLKRKRGNVFGCFSMGFHGVEVLMSDK